MNTIRVLIVSHLYPRKTDPTLGNFVHLQIQHLLRAGVQVRVISPVPYAPRIFWTNPTRRSYGQTPSFDFIEGIPVHYPRFVRAPGSWFHGISCYTFYQGILRLAEAVVKEFQPHILHAYDATPDGYAGLLLKRRFNLPLVCSLLGADVNVYPNYRPLTRQLTQKVVAEADQLVAVSRALKEAAEVLAQPKREIRVIYMGCDTEIFRYNEIAREQVRKLLGIAPQENIVLFVGRLVEAKGIFELIEAFSQIQLQQTGTHLVFVGDGRDRLKLENQVRQRGLSSTVHFVGMISHSEMPHWLSAADLLALPSHNEGLPNAIVEAMACSIPVVATNVGGIPEVVEDKKSGLLIEKGDIDSLTNAIVSLLKDEERRKKMGAYGRSIIEQNFSWQKSAQALRGLYDEIL
jgi:teichuronic acid biosynthesis glycosyltransferase TuaC